MKSANLQDRYALLPARTLWHLEPWFKQSVSKKFPDPADWPIPLNLSALCEYAAAMVLTDGIVFTAWEVEVFKRVVPDWAYGGIAGGSYDALENILYDIQKDTDTASILKEHNDSYNNYVNLIHHTGVSHQQEAHKSVASHQVAMLNYIAWEILSKKIASQQLANFVPLFEFGDIICRSLIEKSRPTIKDALERPYATITKDFGEVQLPLILAVAVSRIDTPQQLNEELRVMHNEFESVRKTIHNIEATICNSTRRGSGKDLRLLRKDFLSEIIKAGGYSLTSHPSFIEKTIGILSLDPLTSIANIFKDGAYSTVCKYFKRPELRLLSAWTKDCAYETVKKLRKIFKTEGSDSEWLQTATLLQTRGTIAWYPSR